MMLWPMNDALADISRLICAARGDDPGAVDQLLRVYQNYLSLLARNWLDTALIRRVDASDVVQETLLKAHAKFRQFRGRSEGELAAWLRQILARTVTDLARRHRAAIREMNRERSLEQSFDNSARALDRVLAASGTSPSKAAERREQGVILANALAGLPPDYREVIVLRCLQQQDWNSVAQAMGRSTDAVRMLLIRALKELRPRIERKL